MRSFFEHVFLTFLFAVILVSAGCSAFDEVEREIIPADNFASYPPGKINEMKEQSPLLKIHMHDGNLYVLNEWDTDKQKEFISGRGFLLNANRDTLSRGLLNVSVDSIAIIETNTVKTSGSITGLTVFMGITAAITIACITNPKACFGSCPTFYVNDGEGEHLLAEGFSSSISPSMEATDIDALFKLKPQCGNFEIEMRNEALETHVVRKTDIIAVRHSPGTRVFADGGGNFWESASLNLPAVASADEGDIRSLISATDNNERFSPADSSYLGAKEYIDLEFNSVKAGKAGLVIGCRQTLLSTYLLYQAYAYMGNNAGYWIAQIERNNLKRKEYPIEKIIGGIEVYVPDKNGVWNLAGIIDEQGPLATDYHFIPLGEIAGECQKIRLKMTKGNWRIDYVSLASATEQVQPVRIEPAEVYKEGKPDKDALEILRDSSRSLVTLPGDSYKINYVLPDDGNSYELFLESRGYYLEWIRKEWIAEENPALLAQMLYAPQNALRRLAPQFKAVEAGMEKHFWNSKYAKPQN